jgi:Ca2+-binding EF-hand superfamily protein
MQQELLKAFSKADPEGAGLLPSKKVRAALEELSYQVLGLNTFQILSLIAKAPTNPSGLVEYIKFVPSCAAMVYSMFDAGAMKNRLAAINKLANNESIAELAALDYGTLHTLLMEAFAEADTENVGELTFDQVVDVINSLSWEYLSPYHISTMITAIDADGNGMVNWTELANFLCDVLEHVERERYISDVAMAAWE